MKEHPTKELEVTVTDDEFKEIIDGAGAIKKKVSKRWNEILMKKSKKKGKGDKFRKFDLLRARAHGIGELTAPITTICKTSIGKKPNHTPVFAIKIDIFKLQLTKQEL